MSRKQERGNATIQRVLDGALACFAQQADIRVSITTLARQSKTSVGSIYHHFGDLDGVHAALYQRSMSALLDTLVAAVLAESTARGGLCAMVVGYLEWTRQNRHAARFIHASAYAAFIPKHAERIRDAKARRLAALFGWLQPHIESGAVLPLSPFLYEMILIGPVAEVARRWLSEPAAIDIEVAMAELPDRLWCALSA